MCIRDSIGGVPGIPTRKDAKYLQQADILVSTDCIDFLEDNMPGLIGHEHNTGMLFLRSSVASIEFTKEWQVLAADPHAHSPLPNTTILPPCMHIQPPRLSHNIFTNSKFSTPRLQVLPPPEPSESDLNPKPHPLSYPVFTPVSPHP
eukprot:2805550-Pyramimonas_sp.AAC.1